jgi:hypothetical protein
VAGACALLFEQFGSAATWADIRQAILQATVRPPGMPQADADNWDPACGHGLLDLNALLSPPMPAGADVWLSKGTADSGTEPFVAETFWNSPALVLENAAGQQLDPIQVATGEATPVRLRVRVANRGASSARDVVVAVWWAPMGAIHPLPSLDAGGGAWHVGGFGDAGGHQQRIAEILPGAVAEAVFQWVQPRDANGKVLPHVLLATIGAEDDPYDPFDTVCAQNNAAALNVGAVGTGSPAQFRINGSNDTDGLVIWCNTPGARLENLPVTALPWRDAAMFQEAKRSDRPLFGSSNAGEDMAAQLSAQLAGPKAVAEITDVLGANGLSLAGGLITIEGRSKLTLPRLRIANGASMVTKVVALGDAGGAIHVLHLSGGRRVGGGTVRVLRSGVL